MNTGTKVGLGILGLGGLYLLSKYMGGNSGAVVVPPGSSLGGFTNNTGAAVGVNAAGQVLTGTGSLLGTIQNFVAQVRNGPSGQTLTTGSGSGFVANTDPTTGGAPANSSLNTGIGQDTTLSFMVDQNNNPIVPDQNVNPNAGTGVTTFGGVDITQFSPPTDIGTGTGFQGPRRKMAAGL